MMIRRLGMILACCGAMALAGGTLYSVQEQEPPAKVVKAQEPAKEKRPALRGAHAIMAKVCELTEDQQKKIVELEAARGEALKQNAEKAKAIQGALEKAKAAGDEQAASKALEEWAALKAEKKEILRKARADVMAVLTDEQMTKWRRYNLFTFAKWRFKAAELTDEQLAKIKALCEKTDVTVDPSKPKARLVTLHKLYTQVETDILSKEQRGLMAMAMVRRHFKKAELTEQQLARIKDEYLKLMAKIDPADAQARAEVSKKLIQKVEKDILTDQQRSLVVMAMVQQLFKKAKLTEQQLARIKDQHTKLMSELDPADPQGGAGVVKKLIQKVKEDILTDKQREAIKPKKAPKPTTRPSGHKDGKADSPYSTKPKD